MNDPHGEPGECFQDCRSEPVARSEQAPRSEQQQRRGHSVTLPHFVSADTTIIMQ